MVLESRLKIIQVRTNFQLSLVRVSKLAAQSTNENGFKQLPVNKVCSKPWLSPQLTKVLVIVFCYSLKAD